MPPVNRTTRALIVVSVVALVLAVAVTVLLAGGPHWQPTLYASYRWHITVAFGVLWAVAIISWRTAAYLRWVAATPLPELDPAERAAIAAAGPDADGDVWPPGYWDRVDGVRRRSAAPAALGAFRGYDD